MSADIPHPERLRRSRPWFKVWARHTLYGTTFNELDAATRGIWFSLLCMACDSPEPGVIGIGWPIRIGYTTEQLAATLHVKISEMQSAVETLASEKVKKITMDQSGIIRVCKWATYQSDYERIKKYSMQHPAYKLSRTISSAIHLCLKGRKPGISIKKILGYSIEDLKAHLERQFVDGMHWGNHGKWHIDHIQPIASFEFESFADNEFKQCWSLSNLRPLWAHDNLIKSSKYQDLNDIQQNITNSTLYTEDQRLQRIRGSEEEKKEEEKKTDTKIQDSTISVRVMEFPLTGKLIEEFVRLSVEVRPGAGPRSAFSRFAKPDEIREAKTEIERLAGSLGVDAMIADMRAAFANGAKHDAPKGILFFLQIWRRRAGGGLENLAEQIKRESQKSIQRYRETHPKDR